MTSTRNIVTMLTLLLALSTMFLAHFLCERKKRIACLFNAQRPVCLTQIGRGLPRVRHMGFSHRAPPPGCRMAYRAHESLSLYVRLFARWTLSW